MHKAKQRWLVVGTIFFGLSLAGWMSAYLPAGNAQHPKSPIRAGDPLPANLFIELNKVINPTVVNISTSQTPRQTGRRMPGYPDPFFDLFQQFMGPGPFNQEQQPRQSLGTGFVIREDGLILTNNHVVDKADVIKVQLNENDKETYDAKVIGKDASTDVALIKIETKKKLPAAKLGSSADLQVGEWVAAFGNPFGHGHTITKGIISALGREIDELNRFPFLQTDASINPGNSGGPLVNSMGLVVGVNTAIDARAQGIGFAIPIDDVKSILSVLEKDGGIKRGFLGVLMQDLDQESANSIGIDRTDGALLTQIIPESPAQKGGLKPYDLVIQLNGKKVSSTRDLSRSVLGLKAGDKVDVVVVRDKKEKKLQVTIGKHPDETDEGQLGQSMKRYNGQKAPFDLGFRVGDYSRELAAELGLPLLSEPRPVILDVERNSLAAVSGLAPGDIILDVNRQEVIKARDVLKTLRKDGINVLRVLKQNRVVLIYLKSQK
ncbi:MAG: Do family serine endopeptidase [Bdellovibrionales bacterium]|nr:Do family serine endopeptidase [Bdellovibrionales bacterium]